MVGAGLTGLAAARRLADRGPAGARPLDLTVLESRDRVGGAIATEHRDGFTLETGADSFITNKPWGVDLCRELGLGDRLIHPDSRRRRSFVVQGGKLLPVPDGFVLMAPSRLMPMLASPVLSVRGKLRMMMDLVLPRGPATADGDESLAAFVRRRFGREALDRLVQPLVGGIYTADPNELSLKATMPQFADLERGSRSVILGTIRQRRQTDRTASGARYGLFASIDDGMGVLPQALAESLPPGTIRTGTSVRRLWKPEPRGPWRLELLDGPPIDADAVILATEAHAAARLVDGFDPELALAQRSIPYASTAIVQIAFRREDVRHPLDGFGAVVPIVENRRILAVSFTSVKFPRRAPRGTVLMRVFVGGATQPELFELDDDSLIAMVRLELGQLIGARGEPLLVDVARHPRAMPQYSLGHLDRVERIETLASRHDRLVLAGNACHGVGIPDCIRSGQDAADQTIARLADPARTAAA